MNDITPQEARRIVREKLSQDWTREIGADAYVIRPGGWEWRNFYVFADGPKRIGEETPIGLGLAAVDFETGEARRLASSETFSVLDEGEALQE